MKYLVIFEKGKSGYGAYVSDLPGCVAVGKDLRKVKRLIAEAIEMHLEGMRQDGEEIPKPTLKADYITV